MFSSIEISEAQRVLPASEECERIDQCCAARPARTPARTVTHIISKTTTAFVDGVQPWTAKQECAECLSAGGRHDDTNVAESSFSDASNEQRPAQEWRSR
jgi:hypothetical protein